jgi:large subunit ribosomal protein L35
VTFSSGPAYSGVVIMPKIKTRKAAAKRFRLTGSGKFMRRRAGHNHLLEHKTSKRKRKLAGVALVDKRDVVNVRLMLPNTH